MEQEDLQEKALAARKEREAADEARFAEEEQEMGEIYAQIEKMVFGLMDNKVACTLNGQFTISDESNLDTFNGEFYFIPPTRTTAAPVTVPTTTAVTSGRAATLTAILLTLRRQ
ncbi:hypothetical protein RvY_12303 [Ramazzottius varieornatus]|uniref:Uncharacterized protein n=1 Tax=Ramazzottius varieornatus TaxID=947166 RepID=A0A1D1VJ10_RAMVA|nr:hypothetical protein RvY_12303 [Ramazzottius varieornatus]